MLRRLTSKIALLALLALFGATLVAAPLSAAAAAGGFDHFVTRVGNRLMDGDKEFRFLSVATPSLGLVEDNYPFDNAKGFEFRWPDKFEIRDHLETIRRMGGQATRIYDISVQHPDNDRSTPRHIIGIPRNADGSLNPAAFNEEGFAVLDQILATANELGVRIFIPITNQYPWHGGIAALSALRGIDPGPQQANFYSSDVLKEDYKAIVSYLAQRTNTITGVRYRDDPAIVSWVFGNEISNAPNAWLTEMAAHFKAVAPKQLTMQHNFGDLDYVLHEPNIDIVATSVYDNYSGTSPETIRQRARQITPLKPYIAFEFGFAETKTIQAVADILIQEGVTGGQLWGLRPHNRDGGFYWHGDEFGGSYIVRAYHYPGFATGDRYDESAVMDLIQRKAYEIRGLAVPPTEAPAAPTMLPVRHVSEISWQGATGARSYVLERGASPAGPWKVLVDGITDDVAYSPIFNDRTAKLGATYFYRVTAQNEGGKSTPSKPYGPVRVASLALTDDLKDFSLTHDTSDGLVIDSGNNRPLLERLSRAVRAPGPSPASPIVFDFEGANATAGWTLPSWMAQSDQASSLRIVGGQPTGSSLAIPVNFPAGSGYLGQAGPAHRFADAPVDIQGRDTVTFSVYAAVAGLSADLVFNGPWNSPAAARPLNVGWNALTFDIGAGSADWPNGAPKSATEWLIRITAADLAQPFRGDVLIDDIRWTSSTYQVPPAGEAKPREQITWKVEGNLRSLGLFTFFKKEIKHFTLSVSTDGKTFTPFEPDTKVFGSTDATYGYWQRVRYASDNVSPDVRYLRVEFPDLPSKVTPQLDRADLEYVPYSTVSLAELVKYYAATGQLGQASAAQLANALDSAAAHAVAGRTRQAVKAMERFVALLNNEARVQKGNVSEAARALLDHDAQAVIGELSAT